MKRAIQALSIHFLAVLTVLTSAGCVGEVYPARPATYTAGVYYDYDYYPGPDIYFYPQGRVYYWRERGRWRSGEKIAAEVPSPRGRTRTFAAPQPPTMDRTSRLS